MERPSPPRSRQLIQTFKPLRERAWSISINPSRKEIEIKHEAISNYMPAMTMPFDVRDTNELRGLEPGQTISFRLIVGQTEAWIG